MNKSVALTSLAWGLFFVLIGVGWALYGYYGNVVIPYIAFGVGIILIGITLARKGLGMSPNWFSLFMGLVACIFGVVLMGYALDIFAAIIVLIGLFIIAEAARSLAKSK